MTSEYRTSPTAPKTALTTRLDDFGREFEEADHDGREALLQRFANGLVELAPAAVAQSLGRETAYNVSRGLALLIVAEYKEKALSAKEKAFLAALQHLLHHTDELIRPQRSECSP